MVIRYIYYYNNSMPIKTAKLVSISEYARHFKIDRMTVYKLMDDGKLTKYMSPDKKPMLSLAEKPSGVKRYKGFRERMIR